MSNNLESFSLRFLFEKNDFRAILRNTLGTPVDWAESYFWVDFWKVNSNNKAVNPHTHTFSSKVYTQSEERRNTGTRRNVRAFGGRWEAHGASRHASRWSASPFPWNGPQPVASGGTAAKARGARRAPVALDRWSWTALLNTTFHPLPLARSLAFSLACVRARVRARSPSLPPALVRAGGYRSVLAPLLGGSVFLTGVAARQVLNVFFLYDTIRYDLLLSYCGPTGSF